MIDRRTIQDNQRHHPDDRPSDDRSHERHHADDRPGRPAGGRVMSADRARPPTHNRGARTARLGRVAVGGAIRLAGDRLDSRGTVEEQRRRRGERIVATIDALVDQLAVMRGAAMKAGQVLSTVEFPGLDEDQAAHLQGRLASLRDNVAPVNWKQMRKLLASEWGTQPERALAHIETEPAAAASIGRSTGGARTPAARSPSRCSTRASQSRWRPTCATCCCSPRCCTS
jgi:hypothetical protein